VLGTIAVSLATFMNVLDTSIANVSIPAISGDLGVSPTRAPGSSRRSRSPTRSRCR
jgi:MFS family permease